MSEQKHTPGPWHTIASISRSDRTLGHRPVIVNDTAYKLDRGCAPVAEIEAKPPKYICDLRGPDIPYPPSEETEANARLISAAPELLAAMKGLFAHCAMVHKHWGDNSNQREADAAISAAHAAIAKAEGR